MKRVPGLLTAFLICLSAGHSAQRAYAIEDKVIEVDEEPAPKPVQPAPPLTPNPAPNSAAPAEKAAEVPTSGAMASPDATQGTEPAPAPAPAAAAGTETAAGAASQSAVAEAGKGAGPSDFANVPRVSPAVGDKPVAEFARRVDLQWEVVAKAVMYELEVADNPDFKDPVLVQKLPQTSFSADFMPGAFFYRVRGVDAGGIVGRWTPSQELNINARPPALLSPANGFKFVGALPDSGIKIEWKTNGAKDSKYLVEVRTADATGAFNTVVVKQETQSLDLDFFPQEVGKYQWSVSTLGAAGMETGEIWNFEVEGVFPRKLARGEVPKRIVRYLAPWWRNHWTIYARYGQSNFSYSLVDQDQRASSGFDGLVGYVTLNLNWEWHDPVKEVLGGIPWGELELEQNRQSVLSESVILTKSLVRMGAWFDEWIDRTRFTPILEFGTKTIAIYQPRSQYEAARSDSGRTVIGLGLGSEYELTPLIGLGASFKFMLESGGQAGLVNVNGDNQNLARRAGNLLSATGIEAIVSGSLRLSSHAQVQGRIRYESVAESWIPIFPPQLVDGIPPGNTTFSLNYLSFDVGFGFKF